MYCKMPVLQMLDSFESLDLHRAAENKLQGDVDIDAQVEAFMKRQAEMESGGRLQLLLLQVMHISSS
jgi:hypothetical protein